MKQVGRFLSKVTACGAGLVAAAFVFSAQAAQQQGNAKVQAIRFGSAEYTVDGSTWNKLTIGTILKAGNSVRTDDKAVVDLFLRQNGPVVRVTPATTLAMTTLTFERAEEDTIINTELGLSNGRILGSVKKLAAASKYDVKTPKATCGIRGTQFDISANGRTVVIEGTVVVVFQTATGAIQSFTVTAGFTFNPTANNGEGGVEATPADYNSQVQTEIGAAVRIATEGELAIVVQMGALQQIIPVSSPGQGGGAE